MDEARQYGVDVSTAEVNKNGKKNVRIAPPVPPRGGRSG